MKLSSTDRLRITALFHAALELPAIPAAAGQHSAEAAQRSAESPVGESGPAFAAWFAAPEQWA
jgi:hypothetical protein